MKEAEIILLFIAGAIGSITKDIIEDNSLVLPHKSNSHLVLGFLGGAIIGGVAGIATNNSIQTAFLAGYAGTSIIENLTMSQKKLDAPPKKTIEQIIRMIAKEETVDPDLAVRVAKCESSLNPKAINTNRDGTRDRGLFQINERWHPQVTDEQAFDPIFATRFFCRAFKNGNLRWWNASKHCWDK